MNPTAVLAWAEDNPALAITGAVLALAVVAVVVLLAVRAAGRAARAGVRTARGLDLVVVGAAGVAILATLASIEAMWAFLLHDLHIDDPLVRFCIVGVLDLSGFIAALMARRDRLRRPGTIGKNSVWVWVVALLLGYFGATEAETDQGEKFRFIIPLIAAFMWDSVIHQDVAEKATLDKAKISTVTGRLFGAIGRTLRSIKEAIVRQGARWGIFHPADEDTATIVRSRWHRQLISRAAKAADALRDIREAEDRNATRLGRWRRWRAARRYNKTVPPFRASIVQGQQLGVIENPQHLQKILWDAAVVIGAEDVLSEAAGRSPWSTSTDATDRPTSVEADRPDVIDGEVIGRPEPTGRNRPTETPRPTDRTGDRPEPAIGRPADRPTEPADRPTPTGRPENTTDRPTERPADPTPAATPTGRPSDRPARAIEPAAPRPADRPTATRRSKEENERLIITALADLLGDADVIAMPSAGAIARTSGVSKSTAQAFLGRTNLGDAPTFSRDDLTDLTKQTGDQS